MAGNALCQKTYLYALEAVRLYQILNADREYVLSKQLLRSASAPGAMAEEAQSAHTKKDFVYKLEIGLKELRESRYWTRLIEDSGYFDNLDLTTFKALHRECLALHISIIRAAKAGMQNG